MQEINLACNCDVGNQLWSRMWSREPDAEVNIWETAAAPSLDMEAKLTFERDLNDECKALKVGKSKVGDHI